MLLREIFSMEEDINDIIKRKEIDIDRRQFVAFLGIASLTGCLENDNSGHNSREVSLGQIRAGEQIESNLSTDGNNIYVPSIRGDLTVLSGNNDNESINWSQANRNERNDSYVNLEQGFGDKVKKTKLINDNKPIKLGTIIHNKNIVSANTSGEVMCKDQEGNTKWESSLDMVAGPGCADDSGIYILAASGFDSKILKDLDGKHVKGPSKLYKLDWENGDVLWEYNIEASLLCSPTIHNEVVYIGDHDGVLHSINTETGRNNWKYNIKEDNSDRIGMCDTAACVNEEDGLIYFPSMNGNLYAIDQASGLLEWEYNSDGIIISDPTLAGGTLCFGSHSGQVTGLNPSTGEEQWTYTLDNVVGFDGEEKQDFTSISPFYKDGSFYVVSSIGGDITEIDSNSGNSQVVNQVNNAGLLWANGLLINNTIHLPCRDGYVYSASL